MSDAAPREQTKTGAGASEPGLRLSLADEERAAARRARLVKLIAVKLALDLIFVCGLAVYTHAVTYRQTFDGALEQIDGHGARGWVVDLERPGADVEVQLFLNGRFAAEAVAREPLPDGRRSFVFEFERSGENEARVYAVRVGRKGERRTLQQIGVPRHF